MQHQKNRFFPFTAFLLFLALCTALTSTSVKAQSDSSIVLTLEDVYYFLEKYHPTARQADLIPEMARLQLTAARGNFDPVAFSEFDNKQFDDKQYYLLSESGLKIPNYIGELKVGYDVTDGVFLNPERNLPSGGQAVLGVSLPLVQGLVLDERRATLKQAKIFRQQSIQQRIIVLNNLYFDAAKAYWNWSAAYAQKAIIDSSLQFATVGFNGIRQSFLKGSLPAIDTLEAFILIQNLQVDQYQTQLELQNSTLQLSNFLWFENSTPLEIAEGTFPLNLDDVVSITELDTDSILLQLENLEAIHPELLSLQYDIDRLDVDRRLKVQKLLPKVNVNYNLLSQGRLNFANDESLDQNYFLQNYKWGGYVSFPLFFNTPRAELKQARFKVFQTELKLEQKTLETSNKIRQYVNEAIQLDRQIDIFNTAISNYTRMLEVERIKFNIGESSIFLINSRQQKLLNAAGKLVKLKASYLKSVAGVKWSLGRLSIENSTKP